jgi:hypothetical protein
MVDFPSVASAAAIESPMIWPMIVLGVVLMLLGLLLAVPILWTIGIILLVVGLILLVLGKLGRSVGGRRHFW